MLHYKNQDILARDYTHSSFLPQGNNPPQMRHSTPSDTNQAAVSPGLVYVPQQAPVPQHSTSYSPVPANNGGPNFASAMLAPAPLPQTHSLTDIVDNFAINKPTVANSGSQSRSIQFRANINPMARAWDFMGRMGR